MAMGIGEIDAHAPVEQDGEKAVVAETNQYIEVDKESIGARSGTIWTIVGCVRTNSWYFSISMILML